MALIKKLPKDAKLCFVGDLIDRGPDSAKVVEFVKSNNHDCILGNHECMMLDYIPPGPYGGTSLWYQNGGIETMSSYSDDNLYQEHLKWINTLPYYIEYPELKLGNRYLVVSHSSFAYHPKKQDKEDLLWNRYVNNRTLPSANDFYNIFGHTVQKKPLIKEYFACIDTGAVFKERKGYGKLTAIHFPSLEVIQQESIEE
jgi:serine/threonine protein phosphatase 1